MARSSSAQLERRPKNWSLVDANGSVLEALTITANEMNEYSSVDTNGGGAVTRTYNENGSLTRDGSASVNGTKKCFYDAFNRLVRVEERQSGTFVTIAEYAYDANSRRVRRHVQNSGALNETVVYYYLVNNTRNAATTRADRSEDCDMEKAIVLGAAERLVKRFLRNQPVDDLGRRIGVGVRLLLRVIEVVVPPSPTARLTTEPSPMTESMRSGTFLGSPTGT